MSSRRILESRAREIILNIDEYFKKERDICKELLEKMSNLKTTCKGEVVIPQKLFATVITHLENSRKVTNRVAAAAQVNKNTVTHIRQEAVAAKKNKTRLNSPIKKPRGKKVFLDKPKLEDLDDFVCNKFILKKEEFNLRKLFTFAQERYSFRGSMSTLRRILLDMGYRYIKGIDGNVLTKAQQNVLMDEIDGTAITMPKNLLVPYKEEITVDNNEDEMDEEYLESDDNSIWSAI